MKEWPMDTSIQTNENGVGILFEKIQYCGSWLDQGETGSQLLAVTKRKERRKREPASKPPSHPVHALPMLGAEAGGDRPNGIGPSPQARPG